MSTNSDDMPGTRANPMPGASIEEIDAARSAWAAADPLTQEERNAMTIKDLIREQAAASAQGLLAQGWTERGARYDVGTYHGDAEALAERLRRETTRDERLVLETLIREHLDAAYQGDAHLAS